MACTLAESLNDPFHRRLRQLRYLHRRFDCYRVERTSSRAGVAPAEVQRLFTAHCYVNYSGVVWQVADRWQRYTLGRTWASSTMIHNIDISRRTFLAGSAALSLSLASKRIFAGSENPCSLPVRVKNVNTTSIRDAVSLGCRTMSSVFDRDDHDIPFFASEVWPKAELSFYPYNSEPHVPGRHLKALLIAEDAFGIQV